MNPATSVDDAHGLVTPIGSVVDALANMPQVGAWLADVQGVCAGSDVDRAAARVSEAILAPVVATAVQTVDGPSLVVVASDADAEHLADALSWYAPGNSVAPFVSRGVPYGGGVAPPPSRVGARARAVSIAQSGGVVIASVGALLERLPPDAARPVALAFTSGNRIDRDDLIEQLGSAGYVRAEQAEERGQFAVRGDIIDVFGVTERNPARIELFDDEVEQLRYFSAYTQRSLGTIDELRIWPASEIALHRSDDGLQWGEGVGDDDPVIAAAGGSDALVSAQSLFRAHLIMVRDDAAVRRELDEQLTELGLGHIDRAGYLGDDALDSLLARAIRLDVFDAEQPHKLEAEPPAFGSLGMREAENALAGLVSRGLRVVVCFPHRGQATRLADQLRKVSVEHLDESPLTTEPGVRFAVSLAATGFVSRQLELAVVPAGKLFRRRVEADRGGEAARAMAAFSHLRVGDFIVHEDHGVGRFAGFETKTVAGVTRDYLYIEFAGADRLYVPHEQIGKITRYVGSDGSSPSLSKLGGKRWLNLKNRAHGAVRELAGELLALYAKRARAVGTAAPEDDELVDRFEVSFPYQETDDQLRAIIAVKEDMERPQPMDRLICGDVGFGKTEVAMRACAKCVAGGRQALVLVPTTVLAQQHLVSFRERFADLPVEVDMVSRFRTTAETKDALARFRSGKLDILVGTHRVLSRDVVAQDLGLVVLDEEQRFGVQQKELLRQMRLEVDVLALSATPIPRTLHMSLTGMRDISIIETPPRGRRPIHTFVGEYDEELLRTAIERELDRDGQVYYLHNRVQTIDECAAKVAQIAPKARVAIGHGQMSERQLEQVMIGFLRGDYDVLVSTTIIESGLDIPTANTLVVERADMLGLAQLYQIRGRVGRSERSAHAYLLYPSARELSEEARARLTTLADFTDLGSGSRIAMRDLELRGAGNLLGAEQSGHVAAVGFELYVEMLAEAVAEVSGSAQPPAKVVTIDAKVDAYVPADYVAAEAAKIDIHRRIALARTREQLAALVSEIEDRFGELPSPVRHLVTLGELRISLEQIGADRLSIGKSTVAVAPVALSSSDASALRLIEPLAVYSASKGEVQARIPDPTPDAALERAQRLVANLADALEVDG